MEATKKRAARKARKAKKRAEAANNNSSSNNNAPDVFEDKGVGGDTVTWSPTRSR